MKLYGLIGYPLGHSFSKKYFTEKFDREGIKNSSYELFEIEKVESFLDIVKENKDDLIGLNVTIPHKKAVIPFLDELDPIAKEIGAVNVIKVENGKLKGYNSDYFGFKDSLENFLDHRNLKALVLGTGGAAKAVKKALEDLEIEYLSVSRNSNEDVITYEEVPSIITDYKLIINTTPLGMHPKENNCPLLPYELLNKDYFLYDLVYNPEETLFMKKGREKGAKAIHGLEMLVGQAEKAYQIWKK